MRRVIAVAAAGLILSVATACGADSEAYCTAVEDVGESGILRELEYSDQRAVQKAEAKVQAVVEIAPEDIKPWWEAIQTGVRVSGKLVAGASSDAAKVKSGVVTLQKMQQATGKVAKDAKNRCDYDISTG